MPARSLTNPIGKTTSPFCGLIGLGLRRWLMPERDIAWFFGDCRWDCAWGLGASYLIDVLGPDASVPRCPTHW